MVISSETYLLQRLQRVDVNFPYVVRLGTSERFVPVHDDVNEVVVREVVETKETGEPDGRKNL